jgi:hypothetical protein
MSRTVVIISILLGLLPVIGAMDFMLYNPVR